MKDAAKSTLNPFVVIIGECNRLFGDWSTWDRMTGSVEWNESTVLVSIISTTD